MTQAAFNRETISFAVANILAHKFRSFLTVLGIIVGIVTVILVASVLVGVRNNIAELFREFGPDNVFVFHLEGDPYTPRARPEELTRRKLRVEYAEQLTALCPSVKQVAAQVMVPNINSGRPITAKYRNYEDQNILVQGATWNYAEATYALMAAGRVYTREEEQRRARVCIIGANVSTALFPGQDATGKRIEVDQALYEVVGVFEKRKGSFLGENRQDNVVQLPAATVRSRYPEADLVVLYCQARPGLREAAFAEIEESLRRLRGLKSGQANDFHASTADLIIQQFDGVTRMVQVATVAIAGLSLLVGGIGVMNIMLMSVTQRTREIGVRMAIGARRRDIVWQFLLEASILTGFGGVIGVAVASAMGFAISWVVPNLPAAPPLWAVLTGLGVSTGTGLLFGVWPAVKAARLDPVDSLHHE
jgi:putative ABC transport system permease protein